MLALLPVLDDARETLLRRLVRVAHRHAVAGERCLRRLYEAAQAGGDTALAVDALYLRFALIEPRGRARELLAELTQAQARAVAEQRPLQAARAGEALGRIAYQQGEYQRAGEHWARALELAELDGNPQMAVAARIGLAQIRYAHGDWAAGLRLHQGAAEMLAGQPDSYLAAKLALNLGVGHLELGDLPAAERQFSHGLAAARRGGHREFEAEAHWHLAQTSLARQQLLWAIADCRLVLDIAARQGYPWLEAAASRTWTEIALARGDTPAAIRSTRHGLALAERIQARAQASAAHQLLAQLLQQEGDNGGALDHLWLHLALQAELERLSQPGAGDGAGPQQGEAAVDELLLQLHARRRELQAQPDPAPALAELLRSARTLLGLAQARLWLAEPEAGIPVDALTALVALNDDARPSRELAALGPAQAAYLALLQRHPAPLALSDPALHPCDAALRALAAQGAACARIELPLFTRNGLAGVLWLVDAQAERAWSRTELVVAAHLGLLFEAVLGQRAGLHPG